MSPEYWQAMPNIYLVRDMFVLPFALLAVWLLNAKLLNTPYRFEPAAAYRLTKQAGSGLAIGAGALLLSVLPGIMLGAFNPDSPGYVPFEPDLPLLGLSASVYLAKLLVFQTLFEELLFRALGLGLLAALLYWLCNISGLKPGVQKTPAGQQAMLWVYSGTAANIIISVAFAFAHRNNSFATGTGIGNVMLAGLVIGQLFVLHRSISSAWGFHFAWNFILAFLGLPVSGYAIVQPVVVGFSGAVDGLITGGAFGPEGSLPASIVLAIIFAMLVKRSWALGQKPPKPELTSSEESEAYSNR